MTIPKRKLAFIFSSQTWGVHFATYDPLTPLRAPCYTRLVTTERGANGEIPKLPAPFFYLRSIFPLTGGVSMNSLCRSPSCLYSDEAFLFEGSSTLPSLPFFRRCSTVRQ